MYLDKPVPLVRRFSPVPQSENDSDDQQVLSFLGYRDFLTWSGIDERYRSVILAEAGAGKTFEMFARAEFIEADGRFAFFIRIEDIVDDFEQAFEVGNAESFQQWLDSQNEAWFFLDSVDEARLTHPRAFEKAIRRFATRIKTAKQRAHICISSRPYAWRPKSDRRLFERHLPFNKPRTESTDENSELLESPQQSESELEIYVLDPLNQEDMRLFAKHRSTPEVDSLIDDLERSNAIALAERPFDLEVILHKWTADRALGSPSELLDHNIDLRLKETDQDKAPQRPLNLGKAREGARMLAAAVVLTGETGIQVPDNTHQHTGIDAEAVLSQWHPDDVRTLLERAIFNDVIYGAVRFRHREVREFLAAEWFRQLLQEGNARHAVENLIFREQYGKKFIAPRLRPILPWLILMDENIRKRAVALHPEIPIEGGDPARLPLPERKKILVDVLQQIVRDESAGSAQDNAAIARIAQPDLTDETLALIELHADHDDAIFFLGRLAWQGNMSPCVPPLLAIATDPTRGIYARIAAARAVITCGTPKDVSTLWNTLLAAEAEIPRKLLAELLQGTAIDGETVTVLLKSIDKLPPFDSYKTTGLRHALHRFIARLPVSDALAPQTLEELVRGLQTFLARPPHLQRRECRVSEEFAWLMVPATHAVERLVAEHADASMQDHALTIMLNHPAVREWSGEHYDSYQDKLRELVPVWPELNDKLFWRAVKTERTRLENDGKRLQYFVQVTWHDHYWSFGSESFPRVLNWLSTRELEDDRLVALSLALSIYRGADKPDEWLAKLRAATKGDAELTGRLEEWLNPTTSEADREWERRSRQRKQKHERQRKKQERARSEWIANLKANPDRVRNPPGLQPGQITNNQYWLLREIDGDRVRTTRTKGADWQSLTKEFGMDVAVAFRDAAMDHWRKFMPGLPSEGAETSSVPIELIFAMAGLQIEAQQFEEFPEHLKKSEILHALRYATWELNGFPIWLEAMHRLHPRTVTAAIETELFWELDNAKPDQPTHRVLGNLIYHAPWLHADLAQPLLSWVRKTDPPSIGSLRYCLHIFKSGGVDPRDLAAVAQTKVAASPGANLLPLWYALWVDAQPDTGVSAVSDWLAALDPDEISHAAQLFITALIGDRRDAGGGPDIGNFQTPEHLKALHVLMHKYIRIKDDIDRAGTGTYSPELRDEGQNARNALFHLLSNIPGKPTFVALTELIEEHPESDLRPWMAKQAYRRAEEDGDLEPWTAPQVSQFASNLISTPVTHRQLFDLTVHRLTDMKVWLERGDASPYFTWQKVDTEPEMRNLVAGWLTQNSNHLFELSQEPELANNQRVDIRLQNQTAGHPIPIELKLLDKGWTGPNLCERLRNQLVGDYLRDGAERYGVMLLIWQGTKPTKRWNIAGRLVGVSELQDALLKYWKSISNRFPSVIAIEVIVIDLTVRATISDQ